MAEEFRELQLASHIFLMNHRLMLLEQIVNYLRNFVTNFTQRRPSVDILKMPLAAFFLRYFNFIYSTTKHAKTECKTVRGFTLAYKPGQLRSGGHKVQCHIFQYSVQHIALVVLDGILKYLSLNLIETQRNDVDEINISHSSSYHQSILEAKT
jgi:hypothetical protein